MAGVKGRSGLPKGYVHLNRYEKSRNKDKIPGAKLVLPHAIKLIFDPETPFTERVRLIGMVLPFIEAKLASIELKAEVDVNSVIGIEPEAINTTTKIIESILSRKK
jgi:hypothetical protein